MRDLAELLKIAALAAVPALVAAIFLPPLVAALVGAVAAYLLLVRVT